MAVDVTYSNQSAGEHVIAALRILAECEPKMDGEYLVLPRARSRALRRALELALQQLGADGPADTVTHV